MVFVLTIFPDVVFVIKIFLLYVVFTFTKFSSCPDIVCSLVMLMMLPCLRRTLCFYVIQKLLNLV